MDGALTNWEALGEELWRFLMLAQRFVPDSKESPAMVDELAWACYKPARDAAGGKQAPPLVYLASIGNRDPAGFFVKEKNRPHSLCERWQDGLRRCQPPTGTRGDSAVTPPNVDLEALLLAARPRHKSIHHHQSSRSHDLRIPAA